jgi:hypothetical protein
MCNNDEHKAARVNAGKKADVTAQNCMHCNLQYMCNNDEHKAARVNAGKKADVTAQNCMDCNNKGEIIAKLEELQKTLSLSEMKALVCSPKTEEEANLSKQICKRVKLANTFVGTHFMCDVRETIRRISYHILKENKWWENKNKNSQKMKITTAMIVDHLKKDQSKYQIPKRLISLVLNNCVITAKRRIEHDVFSEILKAKGLVNQMTNDEMQEEADRLMNTNIPLDSGNNTTLQNLFMNISPVYTGSSGYPQELIPKKEAPRWQDARGKYTKKNGVTVDSNKPPFVGPGGTRITGGDLFNPSKYGFKCHIIATYGRRSDAVGVEACLQRNIERETKKDGALFGYHFLHKVAGAGMRYNSIDRIPRYNDDRSAFHVFVVYSEKCRTQLQSGEIKLRADLLRAKRTQKYLKEKFPQHYPESILEHEIKKKHITMEDDPPERNHNQMEDDQSEDERKVMDMVDETKRNIT